MPQLVESAPVIDFVSADRTSGSGAVAARLLAGDMDPAVLRPWIGKDGRSYYAHNTGRVDPKTRKPVYEVRLSNSPATLRKEDWIQVDRTVEQAVRAETNVVQTIMDAGLVYNLPNAMGTIILQSQTQGDSGVAGVSMDGIQRTDRDRPTYDIRGIPIPIIHSEWSFTARDIAVSRRNGTGVNTEQAANSAVRCVEVLEQMTLGTYPVYQYGGYSVYGLTNFPGRMTKTITLPTDPGWTPRLHVAEWLSAIQSLNNKFFNGPFGVLVSPGWTQYYDDDYSETYNGSSLRARLQQIDGVKFIRKSNWLNDYKIVIFELRTRTIRMINGMPWTPLNWEGQGGLALYNKLMGIQVPEVRSTTLASDGSAICGIMDMTAA